MPSRECYLCPYYKKDGERPIEHQTQTMRKKERIYNNDFERETALNDEKTIADMRYESQLRERERII